MKKKLLILILVVGFLPSTVFATTFFENFVRIEGGVYGTVTNIVYGNIQIGEFLGLDDSHGTSSGTRQTIATGTFTALSSEMIYLHAEGIWGYGAMNNDLPLDPELYDFLYPSGIGSGSQKLSATLTSPSETSSDSGRFDFTIFPSMINIEDVGFPSISVFLPFRAGEEGSWVVDAYLSGTVYAPVPEPATMLLLGSGLIGLAGYGRKKFFKK